jgi:hypothetical protein
MMARDVLLLLVASVIGLTTAVLDRALTVLDANMDDSAHALVYNRVAKAGSTTMGHLIAQLARVNRLGLDWRVDGPYFPNATTLQQELLRVQDGGAYISHANYLRTESSGSGSVYAWINVVREPIDRTVSRYYYQVDSLVRPPALVQAELQHQQQSSTCGCANLEFDACIRQRAVRDCPATSFSLEPQYTYFCDAASGAGGQELAVLSDDACTVDLAISRLRDSYDVVGLTEELPLTIQLLERRLPRWFANASAVFASLSASRSERGTSSLVSSASNPLTGTSMTGAVSSAVRELLASRAPNYADEMRFYAEAKRLFWRRVAEAGLLDETLRVRAAN